MIACLGLINGIYSIVFNIRRIGSDYGEGELAGVYAPDVMLESTPVAATRRSSVGSSCGDYGMLSLSSLLD